MPRRGSQQSLEETLLLSGIWCKTRVRQGWGVMDTALPGTGAQSQFLISPAV